MKPGTQAANADLLRQMMRNLQAADEGTAATVSRALAMQNNAEQQRQNERARAQALRTSAAQQVADSLVIEEDAEHAYRVAMREAQDVLAQVGTDARDSADAITQMAEPSRSIAITQPRRNSAKPQVVSTN